MVRITSLNQAIRTITYHNHKKKGGTINSTNHLSLPVTVINCSKSRDNQKAGNEGHVLCSDRVNLCVFTELCVEHSNEGDTKNGRTSLNVEDVCLDPQKKPLI